MLNDIDRNRAEHILWNAAIVVALVAVVALFFNNRQLAGALAQLDQHDREQIAKLQRRAKLARASPLKSFQDLGVRRDPFGPEEV